MAVTCRCCRCSPGRRPEPRPLSKQPLDAGAQDHVVAGDRRNALVGWRARRAGLTIEAEDMAQVNRMENPDDIEAFYMTRARIWEEERRAEGRVEDRAEGRIAG